MSRLLTTLGTFMARPSAFLIWLGYLAVWLLVAPEEFNWHSGATMATWAMTLFIQRAEHRDTQALQAKLDELLHAQSGARNELTKIDEKEPEEIEQMRETLRAGDGVGPGICDT